MGLCEVCEKIDVRELLQRAASLDHIEGDVNENNECPCCILQEHGVPHHDTYAALKAASDHGCDFCGLIRHKLIEQECGNDTLEDTSEKEAGWSSRPVILVPWKSDARFSGKREPPILEIRVECRSTSDESICLQFEATAPRGMLLRLLSTDPQIAANFSRMPCAVIRLILFQATFP